MVLQKRQAQGLTMKLLPTNLEGLELRTLLSPFRMRYINSNYGWKSIDVNQSFFATECEDMMALSLSLVNMSSCKVGQ